MAMFLLLVKYNNAKRRKLQLLKRAVGAVLILSVVFIGNDDGIYAGSRLVEILSKTNKKCTELLDNIPVYYSTDENKVPVEDAIKDKIVSRVEEYAKEKGYNYLTIDGVKVLYDDGFALVRASNTGPNITARFEAKTEERLKIIEKEFIDLLNQLLNK